MAANGNPVFETVGGDVSDATVSSDGGKTQVKLADVLRNQASLTTEVATATQTAATANSKSDTAVSTANSAADTANAAVPMSRSYFSDPNTWDTFAVMKGGQTVLAGGGWGGAMVGQGFQAAWNIPSGAGNSCLINVNPGTAGGFGFFDVPTGTGVNADGSFAYADDWCAHLFSWGHWHVGRKGATAHFVMGRPNSNNWQIMSFYSAGTSYVPAGETGVEGGDARIIAIGGTGAKADADLAIDSASLKAYTDGAVDLGTSGNRFNNLYLAGTVNQTSDATEKTVVGNVADPSYADSAKLLSLYDHLTPVVYQYNSAIANKGSGDARFHIGAIAQAVKAAFEAVGLDASQWSIWSEQELFEQVQIPVVTEKKIPLVGDDGKPALDANGVQIINTVQETTYNYETRPILDAAGNPRTRQALNYSELLMLYVSCGQARIKSQADALTALTARVAALETKAGVA